MRMRAQMTLDGQRIHFSSILFSTGGYPITGIPIAHQCTDDTSILQNYAEPKRRRVARHPMRTRVRSAMTHYRRVFVARVRLAKQPIPPP